MKAFRIEWMTSERDWGTSPDGYSLHTTIDAAKSFLKMRYIALTDEIPEKFDSPVNGWREPAIAVAVELPEDGYLITEFVQTPSIRVVRDFMDAMNERKYEEARDLEAIGDPISVSYGEKGYSAVELELLNIRREIFERLESGEISPERAIAETQVMIKYLGWD